MLHIHPGEKDSSVVGATAVDQKEKREKIGREKRRISDSAYPQAGSRHHVNKRQSVEALPGLMVGFSFFFFFSAHWSYGAEGKKNKI